MHEAQVTVSGRVQGILFRRLVQRYVRMHALTGYICNKDSGEVYMVLQGTKQHILACISWIQTSPGFSNVQRVAVTWAGQTMRYKTFTIIRSANYLADKLKSLRHLGNQFFSSSLPVPVHVAIIPDGNRRWARRQGQRAQFGHYHAGSMSHMRSLLHTAQRAGVKCLSLWGFSTENWSRSVVERRALFSLIQKSLPTLEQDAHEHHIRFVHAGRTDRLPKQLMHALSVLVKNTKHYTDFTIVLCLDYGGIDEVVRATQVLQKKNTTITASSLLGALDTAGLPGVDLIIRTSGEQRTSGFMPLQAAYAELYFSERYFPDFSDKDFLCALKEYGRRQRRFGK